MHEDAMQKMMTLNRKNVNYIRINNDERGTFTAVIEVN